MNAYVIIVKKVIAKSNKYSNLRLKNIELTFIGVKENGMPKIILIVK